MKNGTRIESRKVGQRIIRGYYRVLTQKTMLI